MISLWSSLFAAIRAVEPSLPVAFTSAPCASKASTFYVSPIDAASINKLEKYGFYIDDKDTTVSILFADNKNYIATAFHKRGDKDFFVEGQDGIRGVERSINRAPDDKGNKRLRIARAPGELKGFL